MAVAGRRRATRREGRRRDAGARKIRAVDASVTLSAPWRLAGLVALRCGCWLAFYHLADVAKLPISTETCRR